MQELDDDTGSGGEEEDTEPAGLWWTAVFKTDRAYGGPEEGGWYYDASELVGDPAIYAQLGLYPAAFPDEDGARDHAARMSVGLDTLNAGRPSIYSVLSLGVYEAMVLQVPALPQHWPERRPRYE